MQTPHDAYEVAKLAAADVIACEDTRRTGRLLQLAGIAKRPLTVVNDHTEDGRTTELVGRAAAGELVARDPNGTDAWILLAEAQRVCNRRKSLPV